MLTDVKQAIQDMIIPEFRTLGSEIKRLDEKIDGMDRRLNEKIDGMDRRLNEKIDGLDERLNDRIDELDKNLNWKITELDKRLNERMNGLEEKISSETAVLKDQFVFFREELKLAIDIHERLAKVEARIISR